MKALTQGCRGGDSGHPMRTQMPTTTTTIIINTILNRSEEEDSSCRSLCTAFLILKVKAWEGMATMLYFVIQHLQ